MSTTARDKAREAAARYARMDPDEKCIFAGSLLRRQWYSYVLDPERYPLLEAKHKAARVSQIPPWLLGEEYEGVRTWIAMGGRGSGKLAEVNTPLLTANRGWQTMGSVRVGDIVFDENGAMCNVTYISDVTDQEPTYKLTFSDGSEIIASDRHEWITTTHAQRKAARRRAKNAERDKAQPSRWSVPDPTPVTTMDIIETMTQGKRGDLNHAINVCGPLRYPDYDFPVDPYDLGIWLGDGSTHQRDVHLADRDSEFILAEMTTIEEGYAVPQKGCTRYRMTLDTWHHLKDMGLPGHKFIPIRYMQGSIPQRRRLLAGLLDTDGYVAPGSKCELTLCNETLANDAFDLILGLGIKATIAESDAVIDGRVVGRRWRIIFRLYEEHQVPLQVEFKSSRVEPEGAQAGRQKHRMITSIERIENRPMRCIAVDSPSHLYLIGRTLIPTHNTRLAAGWFIPEMLTRPGYRLGVLGPDFKVSVGVCIKGKSGIHTLLTAFDSSLIHKFDEVKNILTLVNGSQAFCYSSEYPKSLEGPEHMGYWVDEVAELHGQGGDNCIWRKRAEPGIRLVGANGEPVRKIITGTPEATPLIKDLHDSTEKYPQRYYWTRLATRDNIANLDADQVEQLYEEAGTSQFGKMKLEGHLILSSPHALLSDADLSQIRVDPAEDRHRTPEKCQEVVLVVDANHSEDKKSDECGIHVMGRYGRYAHVFADCSTGDGPKAWGERIIAALAAYPEIDKVVVEDDKSLVIDVVERVLRDELREIGRPIKVHPIHHRNRSKKQRADPVAVEYQLKHVLHDPCPRTPQWADLTLLEWQWVSWNPKDPKAKSPDRVDAVCYGVEYLLLARDAGESFHSPGR